MQLYSIQQPLGNFVVVDAQITTEKQTYLLYRMSLKFKLKYLRKIHSSNFISSHVFEGKILNAILLTGNDDYNLI